MSKRLTHKGAAAFTPFTAMTAEQEAERQALLASAAAEIAERQAANDGEMFAPENSPGTFQATFTEGERSVDGRVLAEGAVVAWRIPSPLLLMTAASHGAGDPGGAQLAGTITEWERDGNVNILRGFFDDSEAGREAHRLIADGVLNRWSPDMGDPPDGPMEAEFEWEGDASEEAGDFPSLIVFTKVQGIGATIVPKPALDSARIEVTSSVSADADADDVALEGEPKALEVVHGEEDYTAECDDCPGEAVTAAVVADLGEATAEWFADPQLSKVTPLTVTADGRVFGHIAAWGTCHIGFGDTCVTPPRSRTDYAYFLTGARLLADGTEVPVGNLTSFTGHAPLTASMGSTIEHYDNTGHAWADVTCGEDAYGIWVAGAVRPGVTEEVLTEVRASSPSGDWRKVKGSMELVAVLSVNVPGFPVQRTAIAASAGTQTALVAAGIVKPVDPEAVWKASIEAQLAEVQAILTPLRSLAAKALLEGITPTN
jgi:hypothetical protein